MVRRADLSSTRSGNALPRAALFKGDLDSPPYF